MENKNETKQKKSDTGANQSALTQEFIMSMMTKMSQFIESITLLNESMLVIYTCKNEKEKKEYLKVCTAKIKWAATKTNEENNKRKINKIAETSDQEEEERVEEKTADMESEAVQNESVSTKANLKGIEEYILKNKLNYTDLYILYIVTKTTSNIINIFNIWVY